MTHIKIHDPAELFVGALEEAGASEQELWRFGHLKTNEARFAVALFVRNGVPVGVAIDSAQRTERRLDGTGPPR